MSRTARYQGHYFTVIDNGELGATLRPETDMPIAWEVDAFYAEETVTVHLHPLPGINGIGLPSKDWTDISLAIDSAIGLAHCMIADAQECIGRRAALASIDPRGR